MRATKKSSSEIDEIKVFHDTLPHDFFKNAQHAEYGIAIAQHGVIKYVNQYAAELAGHTVEELNDMPFLRHIHPDDILEIAQAHKKRMEGEDTKTEYEVTALHKNGDTLKLEVQIQLIRYNDAPADLAVFKKCL